MAKQTAMQSSLAILLYNQYEVFPLNENLHKNGLHGFFPLQLVAKVVLF